MLANSLDHIFTSYAVNLLGGIEVSINTGYRGAALEHAIRHCGAKLIVVQAQFLPLVHTALPAVPALETVVVVGTAMDGGDWGGFGCSSSTNCAGTTAIWSCRRSGILMSHRSSTRPGQQVRLRAS